jgi:hypothetical protein
MQTLSADIATLLETDASDAPKKLGASDSTLYASLKWAQDVTRSLDGGLEATVKAICTHATAIASLPSSGIPGELKGAYADQLERMFARFKQADFFAFSADFDTFLNELKRGVHEACTKLGIQQAARIETAKLDLAQLADWKELNQDEKDNAISRLEALILNTAVDVEGLRQLLARDFDIRTTFEDLKASIHRLAEDRRYKSPSPASANTVETSGHGNARSVLVPRRINSPASLDKLIEELMRVRSELKDGSDILISFSLQGDV